MRLIPIAIVLAACSDYNFNGDPGRNGDTDDTDVTVVGETDTEVGACEVDLPGPRSEHDDTCDGVDVGDPPEDPWDDVVRWQFSPIGMHVTPTVGDLDGDGVPSVVVTHGPLFQAAGTVSVLSGLDGSVEWQANGAIDGMSGTALGDVDGDGDGDVIATEGTWMTTHTVVAYDGPTGDPLWRRTTGRAGETYPAIADLDGDGEVEVIVNEWVLDGGTGAVEFQLAGVTTDNWGGPAIGDIDLDGTQEIVLESKVFDATGARLWTCGGGTGDGTWPQLVNADGDDFGELLVVSPGAITLCDDDGTVLWTRTHSSYYGTAAAVGDFDDDGEQEFAIGVGGQLMVLQRDNTVLWSSPIADPSGLAGATSWDIDLDGVSEVIYADELDILVFDGRTGAVVIREPQHGSVTLAETPAVADVDGDGTGELIYTSDVGWLGVTVIGGTQNDWPYSRPVYNQETYSGVNIADDLSVPANPTPAWLDRAKIFRGQPSGVHSAGAPNLEAEITDACSPCDGGAVVLAVQVWNSGTVAVTGARAQVLSDDTVIDEWTVDLAAGASDERQIELDATEATGALTVRIDPNDRFEECDERDNAMTWPDALCP